MQIYTLWALLIVSFPCLIIASYNGWLFAYYAKPLFTAALLSIVFTWIFFLAVVAFNDVYIYDIFYIVVFPFVHYFIRKKRNIPFSGCQFCILTGLGLSFFAIVQFMIYLVVLAIVLSNC